MNKIKYSIAVLGTIFCIGNANASEPIRIGSVLSTTGPAAFLGDPQLKTLELYVKKINSEGGVLGRKLELVNYDDSSDAGKANSFTKRLIESDKVDFIIGGSTSGATFSMIPLIEKSETPFMSLGGAVGIVEPVKKWVFKISHTDRMAIEKIFEDAKKNNITRMALMTEASGFGQSTQKEAKNSAGKFGIQIVMDEAFAPKDTDVTPQLTRIKSNSNVQAVIVAGFGQGPVSVTRNYRQMGMSLPIYHLHGAANAEFVRLAGNAAEGVRLPSPPLLVADELPSDNLQKSILLSYSQAYKKTYSEDSSTFGAYAYDALMVLVNAIKASKSTDKATVRQSIENTTGYVGTVGIVKMSPSDHLGLDSTAFRMVEVKNGKHVLIK